MRKPAIAKILAAMDDLGFRYVRSFQCDEYQLRMYAGKRGVRIVQIWKDDEGIEVYRPASDSNRVDATIEALP